jgi:hypothetical protein
MALVDDLLGCSILEIVRSYWAAKLSTGEWVSEARFVHDWRKGEKRSIDWMDDIVATNDHKKITELWLLCPPSHASPMGNTARLPITRPGTAFQFKTSTYDSRIAGRGIRTLQAHVIGRVENEEGDCTCLAYDPVEGGLVTPETRAYDKFGRIMENDDGTPFYPLKTNVNRFGWRVHHGELVQAMWRPSIAPLGRIALDRVGISL